MQVKYLSPHANQVLRISVNSMEVARWHNTEPQGWATKDIVFVPEAGTRGEEVQIDLDVDRLAPLQGETRNVGVAIEEIRFEAVDKPLSPPEADRNLKPEAVVTSLDMGDPATRRYLNEVWTVESPGVSASWTAGNPAAVAARLPDAAAVEMEIKLMNPHPDQDITVTINGRRAGVIALHDPVEWTDRRITLPLLPQERTRPAHIELTTKVLAPLPGQDRQVGIAVSRIGFKALP